MIFWFIYILFKIAVKISNYLFTLTLDIIFGFYLTVVYLLIYFNSE